MSDGSEALPGAEKAAALIAEAHAFVQWAGADSWGGQVVTDLLARVTSPAECSDCGHVHTLDGCTGDPTPSDLWAGVTPAVCDCDTRILPPGTPPRPNAYRWTRSDGEVFIIDPREVEIIRDLPPAKRVLMTEPHDGHPDTEECPGCPHARALPPGGGRA